MKKINILQINSKRLMKDEELIVIRGGYDGGLVKCEGGSGPYCIGPLPDCTDDWVKWYCNGACPGWPSAICVGPL